MLLILIYWLYLFFVSSTLGIAFSRIIGSEKIHSAITPILGLFAVTLLASIYAIFGGLTVNFETGLLILAVFCGAAYYRSLFDYLGSLTKNFQKLTFLLQLLFVFVFVMALMQSATAPYISDNESYYLPTIKWLDHYGFVPGLANLHIFLGQTSGWHICQSALNLDFIYTEFNDINGFLLIPGTFYVLDKLNDYFIKKELHLLFIGLFPVFYVLLFQFLSAPTPDLPIYVLTIVLFGEYLDSIQRKSFKDEAILMSLALFAFFTKVTAVLLFVFPIIIFVRNKDRRKKERIVILIITLLTVVLFFIKNFIVSGYPLYPLSWIKPSGIDWLLPQKILEYLIEGTKSYAFLMPNIEYENTLAFDLFIHWLNLPKLHGIFNLSMIILLLVFPITFFRSRDRKIFVLIYTLSFAQMALLLMSSPQYRFFLGYMMLLISILLAILLFKRLKLIKVFITLSIFLIPVPLFFNLTLSTVSNNKQHQSLSRFKSEYFIEPHQKTKYKDAVYESFMDDNTLFYTPMNIDFYWGVGDAPLPTIQKDQYDYFKYYFKVAPVQRTDNLKDGYYSKKISSE